MVTKLMLCSCKDGEFTCNNGDCIKMEERCDQVRKWQTVEPGFKFPPRFFLRLFSRCWTVMTSLMSLNARS